MENDHKIAPPTSGAGLFQYKLFCFGNKIENDPKK